MCLKSLPQVIIKNITHDVYKVLQTLWRHQNEHDGISNYRRLDCLFNHLFMHRSKKTSNSMSLAFVREIHQWPVNSRHKGPIMPKMFPFDYFTMKNSGVNFQRVTMHNDIETSSLNINIWLLVNTVDSRYLTPVGSQNSRGRVKWFSRYFARRPRLATFRITVPYSGLYNSQIICWAIIEVLTFPGSLNTSTSQQRQSTTSNIWF